MSRQIFADHPVASAEGLSFEFEGLARTLEELARNPANRMPFTVVIRGDWGRGKTTPMQQVQRRFREGEETEGQRLVRTVWFNAWKYPSGDTVLAGLLGALAEEIARDGKTGELKELLVKYKDQVLGLLLKRAAPWLGIDPGQTRLERAEEKRAFYDSFQALFCELLNVWHGGVLTAAQDARHRDVKAALEMQSGTHGLAVFLDDLDRCNRDRVLEVLEAINLFLDLPGVCFYLGLDWQRLTSLLHERMPGREEDFLEKIVQISLDLPEVNKAGVAEYVEGLVQGSVLEPIFAEGGVVTAARLAEALSSNHPRHVKRVLNDLAMTLAVLENTGKLGDGDEQVPERAVVAWHVLHEVAVPNERIEIRASMAGFEGFLARSRKFRSTEDAKAEDQRLSEPVAAALRAGTLDSALEELGEERLSRTSRNLLVHLGSPPETDVFRGPARGPRLEGLQGVWVRIPAAHFTMGAEKFKDAPPHPASVSEFWISRTPVTQAQYAEYLAAIPAKEPPQGWSERRPPEGFESYPVTHVSWQDAEAFCTWLGGEVRSGEPDAVQLPTEAQWELAARGTEGRAYPWGDAEPNEQLTNFGDSSRGTTPVDRYPDGATPEGVLDLAGNVWEWCRDWYGPYPEDEELDYGGPEKGEGRVLRGGSFYYGALSLRAAYRRHGDPDDRSVGVGFRLVSSFPGGQG